MSCTLLAPWPRSTREPLGDHAFLPRNLIEARTARHRREPHPRPHRRRRHPRRHHHAALGVRLGAALRGATTPSATFPEHRLERHPNPAAAFPRSSKTHDPVRGVACPPQWLPVLLAVRMPPPKPLRDPATHAATLGLRPDQGGGLIVEGVSVRQVLSVQPLALMKSPLPITPNMLSTEAEGMRALSESGCTDLDGTATDQFFVGCSEYTRNTDQSTTQDWCGKYDDTDFTSSTLCCACGG
eukprot:scaffold37860_cov60-Phaeocystis_antarctica.AAC.3